MDLKHIDLKNAVEVMQAVWKLVRRGASVLKKQIITFAGKVRAFVFEQMEGHASSKQSVTQREIIEVHPEEETKRKILVSRCLYGGDPVRYDGSDITLRHPLFLKWKKEGRLLPVCPEVEGGLTVPRTSCERCGQKVLCADGTDVTKQLREGALIALSFAKKYDAAMAIMKEDSPSCGSTYIYDGQFNGGRIRGEGTAVEVLRNAGISVFNEKELTEAAGFLEALETEQDPEKEGGLKIRSGIMPAVKRK